MVTTISKDEYEFVLMLNEPEVSYQYSMKVNHWTNLNLVHVKPDQPLDNEQINMLSEGIKEFFSNEGAPLPLLFFGEGFELELYMLKKQKIFNDPNQLELPL